MSPTSRRKFLKSVSAASVVSTLGTTAMLAKAAGAGDVSATSCATPSLIPAGMENTLGIIGDQVTAKFYSTAGTATYPTKVRYMANGYITWALALSRQRLRIVSNQAKDGAMVSGNGAFNFTSQMDACLCANVSDIICMGGQQDLGAGVALADLKTAWVQVIKMAAAKGKRVWWLTQTPADSLQPTQRADIDKLNEWIMGEASNHANVIAIDVAGHGTVSQLTPSGNAQFHSWKSGNITTPNSDKITPNNVGAYWIGKIIAAAWSDAIPDHFALATDPNDDIEGDPRSYNIIHNSLLNEWGVVQATLQSGGGGYMPRPNSDNFPLIFKNTAGIVLDEGAQGFAKVNSAGAVTSIVITHAGVYAESEEPTISFELGGGSGASAIAKLGIGGFAPDTRTTVERIARAQHGNDAKLTISFEQYQATHGLNYDYTLNADLIKHLGPNDIFAIRCEVTRDTPDTNDKLASVGPQIFIFGTVNQAYDSCGYSADDKPLPEAFTAVFLTPPVKHINGASMRFSFNATNDQSYASNTKAEIRFGRISCLVSPSKVITPVVKEIVKFHPGHYVTIVEDWKYATFMDQDGFNTGIAKGDPLHLTTAAWSGVEKPIRWAVLEPFPGQYDTSTIKDWITNLRAWNTANPGRNPKRLILYLLTDSYNNPRVPYYPQDILDAKEADGVTPKYYYVHVPGGGGKKLKYFDTYVQQRLIALGKRLAEEFDDEPLFEAFRMDETSPGDTFIGLYPTRRTDYVEGQVEIAAEINRAFKKTMFIMGFNFLADQKLSRATRMFIQAGVGMGVVDLVKTDTSLTAPYASYRQIKAASPYVPSLAHFDGGNYWRNSAGPENDLPSIIPFAADKANVSHICWSRNDWQLVAPNYWTLTKNLNEMAANVPIDWDSVTGRSYGLATTRPTSIN
nr:hypothetical protein [uncultured Duganella sp.]